MLSRRMVMAVFFVIMAALVLESKVEARYLPTRGSGDRVDKLKELLKELIESEIEKEEVESENVPRWHPETKLFYKREAAPAPALVPAH